MGMRAGDAAFAGVGVRGVCGGGGRGRGVTTGMAKLRAGDRVYEYVLASEWA